MQREVYQISEAQSVSQGAENKALGLERILWSQPERIQRLEMRGLEQALWRLGLGRQAGREVWKRSDEFQDTLGYINVYVAPSGKHVVKKYSL